MNTRAEDYRDISQDQKRHLPNKTIIQRRWIFRFVLVGDEGKGLFLTDNTGLVGATAALEVRYQGRLVSVVRA
jgi:hypothetical protein